MAKAKIKKTARKSVKKTAPKKTVAKKKATIKKVVKKKVNTRAKKEIGTREIKNGIPMVLRGHNNSGGEVWVTALYNDKPKMNERKKSFLSK
jgi:hypothetical protein